MVVTRATREHVQQLKTQEARHPVKTTVRIADHHGLGSQLVRDFSVEGWPTVACKSEDRLARRDRAITAMTVKPRPHPYHVRQFGEPSGEEGRYPDVFIMKGTCPQLEREINFLRWKDGQRDGKTEGDDHAIDAAEYCIEYANLGRTVRSAQARRLDVSTWRQAKNRWDRTGYYVRA